MKCNVIKIIILLTFVLSTLAHAQVDRTLLIQALQDELIQRGDLTQADNPAIIEPKIEPINPVPPEKELSRGEKIIEEQKRKVREQLAMKSKSVQATSKSMIEEHKQWFSQLKTEHQAVHDQWRELNRQFIKRIPQIKKNLEDSSVFKNVKKNVCAIVTAISRSALF
jgi:hypothetical protein